MPKPLRILHPEFKEPNLTHFGGLALILRFCNRLGVRRLVQRAMGITDRTGNYSAADLVLALIYIVIVGIRRINKTEILQYNGAFLSFLGLPQFPNQSTLRRFLKRLAPDTIRRLVRLHDHLRARLFSLPRARTTLTFDLDSVVLTIYGRHQRAWLGYNPKKRGRRSYHPLLCFEAHLQEFWHGSLRSGKAATSTGVVPFLKRCLKKAPQNIARSRIRIRADAGFFVWRLVAFLEAIGCGFAIVAKQFSSIKTRAVACDFTKLNHGWEAGEFEYQPQQWKRPYRFVVARRPLPEDPQEARQLTLFKDRKYAYHVVVTNLKAHPWRVWQFYAKRATVEKNIRELLYDYPLGKIPTSDWIANVAFFQILLFAYNIVHWFKRLCLPKEYLYATLDTIRTDFIVLPAKLTKTGRRNVLCLPKDYHYKKEFEAALQRIEKLRLP